MNERRVSMERKRTLVTRSGNDRVEQFIEGPRGGRTELLTDSEREDALVHAEWLRTQAAEIEMAALLDYLDTEQIAANALAAGFQKAADAEAARAIFDDEQPDPKEDR
jgi:hypothetical protein